MTTERETEGLQTWVEKIGKPALDSIRDMVAALECDYDRLEDLKTELIDAFEGQDEKNDGKDADAFRAWLENAKTDDRHTLQDAADELLDLMDEAGECESEDDARQRIEEDPLSVEVRSGWTTPGHDFEAEEFMILLTTGGPAVRIRGELGMHNEPSRAWLEVQDWFKPWTGYFEPDAAEVCLAYARVFCWDC